jgi:hypothetical protein
MFGKHLGLAALKGVFVYDNPRKGRNYLPTLIYRILGNDLAESPPTVVGRRSGRSEQTKLCFYKYCTWLVANLRIANSPLVYCKKRNLPPYKILLFW